MMRTTPKLLLTCSLLLSACATTNRGKTIELMIASAATGALYGSSQPDFKDQNAVMYGAAGAAVAGVIGLYLFDEEKRSEEYRQKALELQSRIDGSQSSDGLFNQTAKILSQGQSAFSESDLPDEYQHLIRPGGWKVFEINRWVKKGANRLVLESKLLEFTPPTIQPNSQTN